MRGKLSHLDENSDVNMVDISAKAIGRRTARASGKITMHPSTLTLISDERIAKGNVLTTAKIAAIMAVKRTAEAIPLCHPIAIDGIKVEFHLNPDHIEAMVIVHTQGKTGAEMEALHGVSVALLTIYDMAKAVQRDMIISDIHLIEKMGGKSGHWRHEP